MANNFPPGGVLFPNNKKKTEKHPDYTGSVELDRTMLNGLMQLLDNSSDGRVKLNLSGWARKSTKGNDFISLSGSVWAGDRKEAAPSHPPRGKLPPERTAPSVSDIDDDIPFDFPG